MTIAHRAASHERPLTDVILVFRSGVVEDLMDHSFSSAFEFPPDASRRGLPRCICWNANQAEPAIEFLRVRLGPPPGRSGGFHLHNRIVKANRVRNRISGYPRFVPNPVSKIGGVITHLRNVRSGQCVSQRRPRAATRANWRPKTPAAGDSCSDAGASAAP